MRFVAHAHHFVAIAGRALDETSGKPVAGALAEIQSGPAEFERSRKAMGPWLGGAARDMDRTETAPDGIFYFLDLPDGTYQLRVAAAGATTQDVSVKVERLGRRVAPPSAVDVSLRLPPTPDAQPPKPVKKQRSGSPKK